MSGLLDLMGGSYGEDDPRRAAAIALFAGLLGGKGNLGGIVSDSITGAQKSFLLNREAQQRSQENQSQLEERRRQAEEQRRQQQQQEAWRNSLVSPTALASQNALAGGGGPTVANAAKIQPVDPYSQVLHDMASSGVIGPAGYSAGLGKVLDREDTQKARIEDRKSAAAAAMERLLSQQQAAREKQQTDIEARAEARRERAALVGALAPKAEAGQKPPAGYRWTPDGNLEAISGGPADKKTAAPAEKNLTEDQGKAVSWLERMDQSEEVIKNAPEGALQATGSLGGMLGATIGSVPYLGNTGIAKLSRNTVESPARQAVRTAQEVWVQGLLRSDTGAAYKDMEKDDIIRAFFWQPGESESVRAQKDLARDGVRRAMLVRAGPAVDRLSKVPKTGVSGKWTIEVEK